jgi:biopolymer transport protein ExbB
VRAVNKEKLMNLEGAIAGLVGAGATWVLWLLAGLSVASLTIVLERLVFFSVHGKRLEASIASAGEQASCPAEAEVRMAAESQTQRLRCERNLAFLGTLGNNAPFVGLLGTVIGIIGAFRQLDVSGGQLTAGLMAEIGEALATTALGLLVALPAVAAKNGFQRAIQVRLNRGDARGREVIAKLHARAHASSLPQAAS